MPNDSVSGSIGLMTNCDGFSYLAFALNVGQSGEVAFGKGQGHLSCKRTLHDVGSQRDCNYFTELVIQQDLMAKKQETKS